MQTPPGCAVGPELLWPARDMDQPRGAPVLLLAQEVLERLKSALTMLAKLNHAAADQASGPFLRSFQALIVDPNPKITTLNQKLSTSTL